LDKIEKSSRAPAPQGKNMLVQRKTCPKNLDLEYFQKIQYKKSLGKKSAIASTAQGKNALVKQKLKNKFQKVHVKYFHE